MNGPFSAQGAQNGPFIVVGVRGLGLLLAVGETDLCFVNRYVGSMYTRKEVVRFMSESWTREVAVR
jgi:hypothetical protein